MNEQDLFETPEMIPEQVQSILNKYGQGREYKELEKCLEELKSLGYTFDYGLDAEPYALRKITA